MCRTARHRNRSGNRRRALPGARPTTVKQVYRSIGAIAVLSMAPISALSPADFSAFATPTATVAIHVSEATDTGWSTLAADPSDVNLALAHSNGRGWKY